MKSLAPLCVKLRPSAIEKSKIRLRSTSFKDLKKVAREGEFEVERTLHEGPDDIFSGYYRMNPEKHYVFTNSLVIRTDTRIDRTIPVPDDGILGLEDLKSFGQDCLDDPEKHFYVEDLGGKMGRGLFAMHAIPESKINFQIFITL